MSLQRTRRNEVDVDAEEVAQLRLDARQSDQLGVSLIYDPTGNVTVKAEPRGVTVRVGGGTGPANTPTMRWALAID